MRSEFAVRCAALAPADEPLDELDVVAAHHRVVYHEYAPPQPVVGRCRRHLRNRYRRLDDVQRRTRRGEQLARGIISGAGGRVLAHRPVPPGNVYVVGVRVLAVVLLRPEAARPSPDRSVVDDVLEIVWMRERPRDNGLGARASNHDVDGVHDAARVGIVVGVLGLVCRVAEPTDRHARKAVTARGSPYRQVVYELGHHWPPPPGWSAAAASPSAA